jgi:hypothetical protein
VDVDQIMGMESEKCWSCDRKSTLFFPYPEPKSDQSIEVNRRARFARSAPTNYLLPALKAKETKKCRHRDDDDDDLVEFCQL